jgi:glycerate kinase
MLEDGTAVIEASQANGMWRILPHERDVSRSSTFGVGQLILEAVAAGAKRMIVGIGGSATNDAGLGLAAARGCRFLDATGALVEPLPRNFAQISKIDSSQMTALVPVRVACDVSNPLIGPRGASRIYGPQKGLRPDEIDPAEVAHAHFAAVCAAHFGSDFKDAPGAGAAGGLGYGLVTFCNAVMESGFDCIAGALGVECLVASANLVVTGEGSLDSQTLEGKAPHGIAKLARKHGVPVYGLAGRLADENLLHEHFDGIASIVNAPMSLDEAIERTSELLELAAVRMARMLVTLNR